jgi:hypothetical protein
MAIVQTVCPASPLTGNYFPIFGSVPPSLLSSGMTRPSSVVRLHSSVSNCWTLQSAPPRKVTKKGIENWTYKTIPPFPHAMELDQPTRLPPLDPKTDVDAPVQLVELAPNPRQLAGKVDLVAQDGARGFVGPQRIQDAVDRAGVGLLVVEDGEGGEGDDDDEDGQGFEPGARGVEGGEGAVGEAGKERSGRFGGWGDEEGGRAAGSLGGEADEEGERSGAGEALRGVTGWEAACW